MDTSSFNTTVSIIGVAWNGISLFAEKNVRATLGVSPKEISTKLTRVSFGCGNSRHPPRRPHEAGEESEKKPLHPADGRGEMMTDADLYQLLCKLELASTLCWLLSSGLSLIGLVCWIIMKILEHGS